MKLDAQKLGLARVYARSLLTLARPEGLESQIADELVELVKLMKTLPELERYASNPLVDVEARAAAIETVFRGRMTDLLVNALQVMSRNGRLHLFRELAEAYRLELEVQNGEIDVEIATAVPLAQRQRDELTATAARFTGLTPRLVETVEPSLLGGMVVRIGDRKIDNSVAKELVRLSSQLIARGSKDIYDGKALVVLDD